MSCRHIRKSPCRLIPTALFLAALAPAIALAVPDFEAPFREFPSNPEAVSLAYGDFDEDGLVDAIVSTAGAATDLVFMRQNPDHTFTASGGWAPVDPLTQLVAGDFDGDGHLDVVGLEPGGNNIVAFFGDGHGGALSSFSRPAPSGSIFLAKANLDFGADDLIAVSYWTSTIQAYVNLAGTLTALTPLIPYTTEATPSGIGVGDLNADGRDDILLAHENVAIAEVLYTDSSGAVGSALNVSIGSAYGGSAAIADVNSDGLKDLLIGMTDGTGAAVVLNAGFGAYGTPSYYGGSPGSAYFALRCADLDADGNRDIVLGGPQSQALMNDGTGNFTSAGAALPPNVQGFNDLYLTDVDGDTLPDVLAYGNPGSAMIVARGNGDGTFGFTRVLAAGTASALAIADIDGDGDDAAVSVNSTYNSFDTCLRTGAAFDVPVPLFMFGGMSGLAMGHFDAGIAPDFATTVPGNGELAVFMNDGSGGFPAASTTSTGEYPTDVATGDLDGDGLDDIVVVCSSGGETAAKALHNQGFLVYISTGSGFAAPTFVSAPDGCPGAPAIADVTEDGVLDLVAPLSCLNEVQVFPGITPGTFGAGVMVATMTQPSAVVVRDLDGDGHKDIVALTSAGGLHVIPNTGAGVFGAAVDMPTAQSAHLLVVEDFDLDGHLDAAALSTTGIVAVHPGQAGGVFGARLDFGTGAFPTDLVANDFDHDGDLDLLVASTMQATSFGQQGFWYLRNMRPVTSGVPAGPAFAMLDMRAPAPNPASGSVRFAFRLDAATRVTVDVFDVRGRKVRTLMSASDLSAGEHAAQWELTQDNGAPAPNGVYFARVRAGGREATRKVFVTR